MKKIVGFVKMLWQEDKWLFSIFCIGMLSVLVEILHTLGLVYTTFFTKDSISWSRQYIVSHAWAYSSLIVLAHINTIGIVALSAMIFYIVFMKILKRPVNWKRTITLGTMSIWTFVLWFIFTLILGSLLRLIFPHLLKGYPW